ncbi:MAG: hypothetical protein JO345_21835 [Streptosporangiaceae bacterium]|nr:hypothetical protein [Streptosporangiaceae bacterium]
MASRAVRLRRSRKGGIRRGILLSDEELTAQGRHAALTRWSRMTEDERKAAMERVRAGWKRRPAA